MTEHQTREAWLLAAVEALRDAELRERAGMTLPPRVRVSVGFPTSSTAIGQCWYDASDAVPQVFISPEMAEPTRVLDVLLHECIHACLPVGVGHRGRFRTACKKVGLDIHAKGATTASDELKARLHALSEVLGEYPHAKLPRDRRKRQTTRMLKLVCPDCGYVVRTTAKWLEQGNPYCPDGTMMEREL